MARKQTPTERLVSTYMKRSPKDFKLHIQSIDLDHLNEIADAFEEECEFEYIDIINDEFRRRPGR